MDGHAQWVDGHAQWEVRNIPCPSSYLFGSCLESMLARGSLEYTCLPAISPQLAAGDLASLWLPPACCAAAQFAAGLDTHLCHIQLPFCPLCLLPCLLQ